MRHPSHYLGKACHVPGWPAGNSIGAEWVAFLHFHVSWVAQREETFVLVSLQLGLWPFFVLFVP